MVDKTCKGFIGLGGAKQLTIECQSSLSKEFHSFKRSKIDEKAPLIRHESVIDILFASQRSSYRAETWHFDISHRSS